jgi:membrane-associated HD superfamily phosphohydrolase
MNAWISNWYIFYILAILFSMINIYGLNQGQNSRLFVFFSSLIGLLSLIGFILYIFWLINFNNKNFLQTLWITSLVSLIVLYFLFSVVLNDPQLIFTAWTLIGYLTPIFIGALIAFFAKK